MKPARWLTCAALVFAIFIGLAAGQERTRSVSGVVTDRRGNALKGAAVEIENTRDLSIASYITRGDGRYYFHQLSRDTDFTITAKYKKWWSKSKMLNKLNSKEASEIDLEIPVE
jgi:hypothetical protein